jgi:hypothetical protein
MRKRIFCQSLVHQFPGFTSWPAAWLQRHVAAHQLMRFFSAVAAESCGLLCTRMMAHIFNGPDSIACHFSCLNDE